MDKGSVTFLRLIVKAWSESVQNGKGIKGLKGKIKMPGKHIKGLKISRI